MEGEVPRTDKLAPNPQSSANILSRLTVSWTFGVFRKGYKRELELDDLYAPLEEHKSHALGDSLERHWENEIESSKLKNKGSSLLRALRNCFGGRLMMYGFIMFLENTILRIAQPLLLGRMLQYFTADSTLSKADAWWYAAGVVLCTASSVIISNPVWLGLLHLSMKIRVACCSLMYRKTLRLSNAALQTTTVGEVANLMTNDVNRFDMGLFFVQYLWIGPVSTAIITYFLWLEIGAAALVGVAALLASIPFQMWLGKRKSTFRLKTAKRTDERIRLMNELIKAISVIKMYTWERHFEKLVSEARKLEINEIRGSSYITGIMLSFLLFNNRLAIFCSILTYVSMGNVITASVVYVVTSYFNLIRQMMSDFFPLAVGMAAEIFVSVQRIQKFMLYDENITNLAFKIDDTKSQLDCHSEKPKHAYQNKSLEELDNSKSPEFGNIVLENVSAKWTGESSEETLKSVDMSFPSKKLSVVVGPVGCGKSSLLQVVLRELPVSRGSLQVFGSMSYAAQEPWLFEASVRQNILFGSPYNESRYRTVVRACALLTDFQQLPQGDRTWVGERGVILSGGQRARINLARAVYREADIYLLDDPLSAVDAHVGKHLFEQCISGFLKEKTVILATHQLQFLGFADHVVLLENGNVGFQGSYKDLQLSNTNFKHTMSAVAANNSSSVDNEMKAGGEGDAQLVSAEPEQEGKTEGSVSGKVFMSYLTAGGHWTSMAFLAFMFCLTQFVASASDYWLNIWVNLEQYGYSDSSQVKLPFHLSQEWCITIFTALILATIVISLLRSFTFFFMCMRSSMWLHDTMFASIVRAAIRFFHTNSSGRILNRFTRDIGAIDELLPSALLDVLQIALTVVGIVGLSAIVNAWLLLPTFCVAAIFYYLRNLYLRSSCGIKRLEGITRSPVFSHLSGTFQGLSTIRAFTKEDILIKEFDDHQDLHSSASYLFLTTTRAFGYWLDVICFLYIGVVTFSFLVIDSSWLGGDVGLAITQTAGLVGVFQWGMKQSADVETFMTSVERVLEFTQVEKEPPLESPPDHKPPLEWPLEGQITFENVEVAYDSELPPVLKSLSFTLQPREKIGIVGRTGAGKSTLTAALFRLTPPIKGMISIDGIDIQGVGLHDLRSKISIIPQEPVLFSGSVRKNLDPFEEYPDHAVWNALEEVELKPVVEELQEGLNSLVTEGGSNLSVGQRQLMCLARAILRNNKILVMDEATANVDAQTDALIQSTMRRRFAECTVLTIAHRLVTVIDSDRIMVISEGSIVEFDQPHILLKNKQGHLYGMVEQLGPATAASLHNTAAQNFQDEAP